MNSLNRYKNCLYIVLQLKGFSSEIHYWSSLWVVFSGGHSGYEKGRAKKLKPNY